MNYIILNFIKTPNQVFFIDALGAFISSIFLLIIYQLEGLFGMPKRLLLLLSIIALGMFLISTFCYFFVKTKWKIFLKIIVLFNSTYLLLSFLLIVFNFDFITWLDVTYFSLELLVLASIISIEYNFIKQY